MLLVKGINMHACCFKVGCDGHRQRCLWQSCGGGNGGSGLLPHKAYPPPPPAPSRARSNITIPAVFVNKTTGDALKGLMKGGAAIYVSMDWTDILPRKQQARRWCSGGAELAPRVLPRMGIHPADAACACARCPGALGREQVCAIAARQHACASNMTCPAPVSSPAGGVGVLDQQQRPVRPGVRRAEGVHQRVCPRGQGGQQSTRAGTAAAAATAATARCRSSSCCSPRLFHGHHMCRGILLDLSTLSSRTFSFTKRCLQDFDSHNWTVFTPHYIVWICPLPYRSRRAAVCACVSQCN